MKTIFAFVVVAIIFPAAVASAQDFAIEPIGFTTGAGPSTDGNFSLSGTMLPVAASEMSDGNFAVTGEFRSVIGAGVLSAKELKIGAVEVNAGNFNFSFETVPGRTYTIESRASLESGTWQTIPGTETPGTGQPARITITNPFTESQQFYRVRVQ